MDRDDSPLIHSGSGRDEWVEWPDEPGRLMCSYCGSMRPGDLFDAIEAGERLIPTDKSYKVYVDPGYRKFYFQHFDEAQKMRFIILLNEGRIVFGEPGYFYRTPYFIGFPD